MMAVFYPHDLFFWTNSFDWCHSGEWLSQSKVELRGGQLVFERFVELFVSFPFISVHPCFCWDPRSSPQCGAPTFVMFLGYFTLYNITMFMTTINSSKTVVMNN